MMDEDLLNRRYSLSCAEVEGFEPSVQLEPYTAFSVPHNRPPCHLSEWLKPLFRFAFRLVLFC